MQSINQATIYVTEQAYQTAHKIKDLSYYDRQLLCEQEPGLENQPGYHLKNANKLKLAVLPADANIVLCLTKTDSLNLATPANLRGCIFEYAPNLPNRYADNVTYWSGETINSNTSGAAYFQCKLNAYMVDLGHDADDTPVIKDRLVSEGIVVEVYGLADRLSNYSPDDFIELQVPIDHEMLGNEQEAFMSDGKYGADVVDYERVFLKVADILASPEPNDIYIDLLCNELIDYGYWY